MKKVLSLVLVLAMVLGTFSFAFAASDDITGHDNEAAIRRLATLGLVTGDAQGYRPNDTIKRAEFAALVVRATGNAKVADLAKGATVFADVPAAHWASGYINVANKLGYINGYGNGNFGPEDAITYEQALALIVRALGYEPEAQDKGGYPIGHLVKANDLGLTDDVDGVAGIPASRGSVFQMLDNALIVPMMVAEKVGSEPTYVVDEDKTMLGEIGFDKITGRMIDRVNDDNEIVLENKDGKTVVVVADDFDSEANFGLKLTAWINDDDEVAVFEVKDTPKFDATTGGDKIKLVNENKKYEVAEDAVLVLNGEDEEAADFTADYAKVVLNADNEIVWAEGYTFDDFMVVEEADDDVVYSYDGDELDVEDYTIVKDGATIAAEDLDAEDILFFNEDQEYAVVYNESKNGEIERVYDVSFKFEGDVYDYDCGHYDAMYLDEGDLGVLDKDVASSMKDEGSVEVFFDFAGNAVLVVGDTGEEDTDFFYAVVETKTEDFKTLRDKEDYYTFDVLNEEGKVVNYDLKKSFVEDTDKYVGGTNWATDIDKDAVVKVTVNTDGDIKKVELLEPVAVADVEIDDTYAKGYKLQDSAVVFFADGIADVEDYEVMEWSEAADKFSKVEAGNVYAGSNGKVVVVFATDTDCATTEYVGLITNVRELKSGDVWEVTIEVAGEELEFLTDGTETASDALEDTIAKIKVTDADEISNIDTTVKYQDKLDVTSVSTSKDTITVGTSVYRLVEDAVIYDATDSYAVLSLRDIEEKDEVTVYFANDDTEIFVSYVVRTALAPEDGGNGDTTQGAKLEDVVDFRGNIWLTIAEKDYIYGGSDSIDTLKALIGTEVEYTVRTIDGEEVVTKILAK